MKTVEDYEIIKVQPYNVYTTIYMNTKFDAMQVEKGLSGVVRDPDLDDRFTCAIFCIWNANGDCVYKENQWGLLKSYKIQI